MRLVLDLGWPPGPGYPIPSRQHVTKERYQCCNLDRYIIRISSLRAIEWAIQRLNSPNIDVDIINRSISWHGTRDLFMGRDETRSLWDGSSWSRPGSMPGPGSDEILMRWDLPSRSRGQPIWIIRLNEISIEHEFKKRMDSCFLWLNISLFFTWLASVEITGSAIQSSKELKINKEFETFE